MKTCISLLFFPILFLIVAGCENSRGGYAPSSSGNLDFQEEALIEPPSPAEPPAPPSPDSVAFNTEEYDLIRENEFLDAVSHPLSTFSIDVDNAAYSNVRRFLEYGERPPADAIRLEELINYFDYDYPEPAGEHPFSVYAEISAAPWNPAHQLVHLGLRGKGLDYEHLPPANLVFLIDCSGSMSDENKLPLLKKSFDILLEGLGPADRVAIVAYAGSAGLVLNSTPATERETIRRALNRLEAGGSTAGGEGIQLAYQVARENLIDGGNNRVILATDGDFNVGVSSSSELVRLIEEKRREGVYLTICGFGMGNYKDGRMEQISNAGNGNYFYIDALEEADKVFRREMRANLFTIAKDVKIQVEFNPARVKGHRLLGYENRRLAAEDFNDDAKDAGELGAGHTVTALYEIIPADSDEAVRQADPLKYQTGTVYGPAGLQDEWLTVKLRYKRPAEEQSILLEEVVTDRHRTALSASSDNFRFAAAVAAFGMLLRESKFKGEASWTMVEKLAAGATGHDGDRAGFMELVKLAAGEPLPVPLQRGGRRSSQSGK